MDKQGRRRREQQELFTGFVTSAVAITATHRKRKSTKLDMTKKRKIQKSAQMQTEYTQRIKRLQATSPDHSKEKCGKKISKIIVILKKKKKKNFTNKASEKQKKKMTLKIFCSFDT